MRLFVFVQFSFENPGPELQQQAAESPGVSLSGFHVLVALRKSIAVQVFAQKKNKKKHTSCCDFWSHVCVCVCVCVIYTVHTHTHSFLSLKWLYKGQVLAGKKEKKKKENVWEQEISVDLLF